jgi:two-component system, chemotaxis family, chemotaxis protein CheY
MATVMTAKRILVVDDMEMYRRMASRALIAAGYEVLEAENGEDGLQVLAQSDIHAVVSDLNMPIMDGLTMIARIRANPTTRGIPVLMVTTESSAEIQARGRAAGATGWLVKPYKPAHLLTSLRRVCA